VRRIYQGFGLAVIAVAFGFVVACGDDDDVGTDPRATVAGATQTPCPTEDEQGGDGSDEASGDDSDRSDGGEGSSGSATSRAGALPGAECPSPTDDGTGSHDGSDDGENFDDAGGNSESGGSNDGDADSGSESGTEDDETGQGSSGR
jgi:hypothetical protein